MSPVGICKGDNTMAYGKSNTGNFARTGTQAPAGQPMKAEPIFSTGLFVPDAEAVAKGVSAMASIQVKEDITIPAGSYIAVYDNSNDRKSETSPHFRMVVKPGKQK
jgi:hypothetical protein